MSHHALLILLLQIAVLLGLARVFGEFARRYGWPAVVGELLAGIFLGPTVLGKLFPAAGHWLFPGDPAQIALLTAVGRLGVLLLLLVTGMEIDLRMILNRGNRVLIVSFFGTAVPLLCGVLLGLGLPDFLLQDPARRTLFAMFMAVAMSISALAVLAKVLFDIQAMGRELSQSMVAIAMTEDLAGWILLSAVVGFASGGKLEIYPGLWALASAVAFLLVAFTLGRWLVNLFLTWVDNRVNGPGGQVSAVIVLTMLSASATHALHLEPMLGALVMGMLIGQARRFQAETENNLKVFVSSFLSPVFFASAGLKVDLLSILNPTVVGWGLAILAVAFVSKLIGAALGGRIAGFRGWELAAIGVGLNARGSMEIIVATVGLNLGILAVETYSVVVLIAVSSCLLTPPVLRRIFDKIPLNQRESDRISLQREPNFWHSFKRVLIPLQSGQSTALMSQVATWLGKVKTVETTVLQIEGAQPLDPERQEAPPEMQLPLPPKLKRASKREAQSAIVRESGRGYQLLMVSTSESKWGFFNSLTDGLVRDASCPVAVLRGPGPIGAPKRILFPTSGSPDTTALDLAAALSAATGAELTLLHVLETDEFDTSARSRHRLERLAAHLLEQQAELAARITPHCHTRLVESHNVEREIARMVRDHDYDLVVLRGVLRRMSRRAFLGHRAERLLAQAEWPLIVVCS